MLLAGTDWGNNNVTRPELHHVLGDNWDSNPDEDWFGVDLEQGEGVHRQAQDQDQPAREAAGHPAQDPGHQGRRRERDLGTASAGDAGKKVFRHQLEAPSTGRFHIAVGSEGTDRTGMYWLSITKKATN